ncbi:MAG: general stress protein [Kastovskya adunca ATA6-11-RM4]|jgi:hypothetical protein|nr:general stress protein [Kastovskya adunca ATA6-11-RM4]
MTTSRTAHHYKRAIGVFNTRADAERALHDMKGAGYNLDDVSIIARETGQVSGTDVHEDNVGNKAGEGAATGAVTGGALGGLTGLLVGLGAVAIPGIGPVMLAGAGATALATTLSGGAIGALAGGLVGALIGLGIPEEHAKVYRDRVSDGGYLLMVTGTEDDIRQAETLLHKRGIEEWRVYDAPDVRTSSTTTATTTATPVVGTTPPTTTANPVVDTTTTKRTVTNDVHEKREVIANEPEVVIIDRRDDVR